MVNDVLVNKSIQRLKFKRWLITWIDRLLIYEFLMGNFCIFYELFFRLWPIFSIFLTLIFVLFLFGQILLNEFEMWWTNNFGWFDLIWFDWSSSSSSNWHKENFEMMKIKLKSGLVNRSWMSTEWEEWENGQNVWWRRWRCW